MQPTAGASLALACSLALVAGCGRTTTPDDAAIANDTGVISDMGAAAVDAGPIACMSDRVCTASGRLCDLATGLCDDCSTDADCTSGGLCLVGACAAPIPCATSRDCPGLVCDPTRGHCVECNTDLDCTTPLTCRADGRCALPATPCTSDAQCPGAHCLVSSGACVACLVSTDCPSGENCSVGHNCIPPTCTCATSADCDDGLYCNGAEHCAGCTAGCMPGTPVTCSGSMVCDEASDACVTPPSCALPGFYFTDADGDGFGDDRDVVRSCTPVSGRVPAGGDCDDLQVSRHPGASELCDGADSDCDGSVDEGCPCTGGTLRACGLGVGACVSEMQMCQFSPEQWGLCYTAVPHVESCNGIDDDCDGATDEAPATLACGAGSTCSSGRCTVLHAAAVFTAPRNAFAVMTDGTLYAWASGGFPSAVPAVSNVRAFAASSAVSCAITPDEHLLCEGQCGSLPTSSTGCSSTSPTTFADFGAVPAAAIGTSATVGCILGDDGVLRGWGTANDGMLGAGAPAFGFVAPSIVIAGLPTVIDFAVGGISSCAIGTGGSVYCWGRNDYGNLGGGGPIGGGSADPVHVAIDDALDIAVGLYHFCARRVSGEIWCWGTDDFGELGDGAPAARSSSPVRAMGLPTDAMLPTTLADNSTCVIRASDGHVLCFGYGPTGALGDGRGVSSATPVEVTSLANVVQLSGAGDYWCAVTSDQHVSCWGTQVGAAMQLSPGPVIGLP